MKKVLYIGCMASLGVENGFTKAMRSVCEEYTEISVAEPNLNQRIQQVAAADLVFIQIQATGITKESINWLKYIGAYVINWSGDVRQPLPDFYIEMAKVGIDLTCFSNMQDVIQMRDMGFKSDFLQIGYDPEIYYPDGEKYNSPEIVFMGNNCGGFPLSDFRQQMVSFLKATYKDNFGVYGSGWSDLESDNYMGDQHGEAAVYRGAKIGINLSHFDCERYTSDRMFRQLGCGICVLSHQFKGFENDFTDHEHIATWSNLDNLKAMIDLLLADVGRERIAVNGNDLAVNNFTFTHMAKNILKLYEQYGRD